MDRMIEEIELNDPSILTMSLELRKAFDMCGDELKRKTISILLRDNEQMNKKLRDSYKFNGETP